MTPISPPPADPSLAPGTRTVSVVRETDVAKVLIAVNAACAQSALPRVFCAHVATAASELANNLWQHATHGGTLTIRARREGTRHCLEIESRDDGPGIADLDQAQQDGFSTAGGLGCGLPGARRLMDEFEIESTPGQGTLVRARKWHPA